MMWTYIRSVFNAPAGSQCEVSAAARGRTSSAGRALPRAPPRPRQRGGQLRPSSAEAWRLRVEVLQAPAGPSRMMCTHIRSVFTTSARSPGGKSLLRCSAAACLLVEPAGAEGRVGRVALAEALAPSATADVAAARVARISGRMAGTFMIPTGTPCT